MTILSIAKKDKLLSQISTFGIGGPARYFLEVTSIEQMQNALACCHIEKIPYIIIGKGSNSLFDDRGFDGLVIWNRIHFCDFQDSTVFAGAGYSFSLLGVQTARRSWSGLEFASGIPGAVGGAVYMNAGANGVETSDALLEVVYVDEIGELQRLKKSELTFRYRYSIFHELKGAIVAALFHLTPCTEARKKQLAIIDYRLKTQPYADKSAGCVFRNTPQISTGALIQQCGLKGMSVGGAQVSPLHANFIVNVGNARAQDVLDLVEIIKKTVQEKTGILLEMEIRKIPYQF